MLANSKMAIFRVMESSHTVTVWHIPDNGKTGNGKVKDCAKTQWEDIFAVYGKQTCLFGEHERI